MRLARLLLAVSSVVTLSRAAEGDMASVRGLFEAKHYAEAKPMLLRIAAAEPKNAEARRDLAAVCKQTRDVAAYEEALKWLAQAMQIDPNRAADLADYGGTSLELADMLRGSGFTQALHYATQGRAALEKSLAFDPDNLDVRESLFQFYSQAPWPIGSTSKARAQLAEIARRDPDRGLQLDVVTKTNAEDYEGSFQLCEQALARRPDAYLPAFLYGRTASISGQHLERGLSCLQKAVTLSPPAHSAFGLTAAWYRLGQVQTRLNHAKEAREAYSMALKLDPHNRAAAEALAKLG